MDSKLICHSLSSFDEPNVDVTRSHQWWILTEVHVLYFSSTGSSDEKQFVSQCHILISLVGFYQLKCKSSALGCQAWLLQNVENWICIFIYLSIVLAYIQYEIELKTPNFTYLQLQAVENLNILNYFPLCFAWINTYMIDKGRNAFKQRQHRWYTTQYACIRMNWSI